MHPNQNLICLLALFSALSAITQILSGRPPAHYQGRFCYPLLAMPAMPVCIDCVVFLFVCDRVLVLLRVGSGGRGGSLVHLRDAG
jgi:hypothetical protein